jgi:integrase
MSNRFKTKYPGVFFREARRIGGTGTERVYYIVFKKDGKVLEEKVGRQYADDMTMARAAGMRAERIEGRRLSRKEIRQKEEAQKKAGDSRWTIDRLWEEYSAGKASSKSLATDENRYVNHIKPVFGDKEPKDLHPLEIDRLRIKLLKTRKPQTVRHVLEVLKRMINFGVKKRLCLQPDFTVEFPKVNNLKTEDLTPEQLARLLEAIEEDENLHAANLMKLALFTGLRRGEMFKLKWEDIDFERGFIHIRDPKGGPDEKVPLNDAARALFESHPKSDSPFVFPGRGGRQRTDMNKQLSRIKERAGIPKDFRALHGLRHVYASMLASSGKVDMYTLQKLLTHKSPQMTQRYAHLRDETLRKAANLAGDLIEGAMSGKGKKKMILPEEQRS